MVFSAGCSVLAYHGPLIYEAKVIQVKDIEMKENNQDVQYLIHYQGWKNKWDEWVNPDRVLEDNPTNRDKQEQAKFEVLMNKKKKKEVVKPKKEKRKPKKITNKKSGINKKIKIDADNDIEERDAKDEHVPIPIPFNLKKQLVDDWELITSAQTKLVPLPKKPSVSQIIDMYMEYKKSKLHKPSDQTILRELQEVMDGIRVYFERSLNLVLLYRQERFQYEHMKQTYPDKPMSTLYGAEHLLRLFVRLPYLLGHTSVKEPERRHISTMLGDFLKYLQKNQANWFACEYENVELNTKVQEEEEEEEEEKPMVVEIDMKA